jgi:PAS domain S-box-containing protein
VLIAILASYAALDLAGRVTSASGRARVLWLIGGANAMGLGIWSMHYIGMLAFHLPVPVRYDWPTVLASLAAAVGASAIALYVASRREMGLVQAAIGSVFMGGGIAAMHFIGMAAMRLDATHDYSPALVTLSVALAIGISLVALWLSFQLRGETRTLTWRKLAGALVMGAAIPVMHYTGMAAATFTEGGPVHGDHAYAVSVDDLSIVGITTVTLMVLLMAVVSAFAHRKFALQAIELEASRRHHQIIEASLDAFVGMNEAGQITDWNAQAETTFGWTRGEAIGQSLGGLIVPPVHRNAHARGLRHFLKTGHGPVLNRRIEISALHKDGHEFPIELAICPVKWGNSRGFSAFVRDVTERQRAQEALAQKMEELARSNAELQQFAYVASHDLQEPLRMVASYTQLLRKRYHGRLDQDADDFIGFAVDGATRMQTLIQDLLSYSRVTTRGDRFRATQAQAACDDAIRNLTEAIADARGDVTVDPLPCVMADATQLTQVFQNLIGNAVKYRGERTPAIRVSATRQGPFVHFSVQDNGIGIEPQYFERIFQMFQRLHTMSEYAGTGIGLALCRKIVERHKGRIWVASDPGSGSTFTFTMPWAEGMER